MASIPAIIGLAAGLPAALAGPMPPPRLLFDEAWFSATLFWFTVYNALMRPAAVADAHITPALPETR